MSFLLRSLVARLRPGGHRSSYHITVPRLQSTRTVLRLTCARQLSDFGPFVKTATLSPLDQRGWLATQPAYLREWAAEHGRWHQYAARQVLYDAGDLPDGLYGLGEGALEITISVASEEPVLVHRAVPGFWIGESALFARATRSISISAATDARVFRIPGEPARALVAERPAAWQAFYELSHLNATNVAITFAEVLSLSASARLARILLRLAHDDDRITVSQDDLARLLGMTRSSLQRMLSDLVEAGIISPGYRRLVITDRARLEDLGRLP